MRDTYTGVEQRQRFKLLVQFLILERRAEQRHSCKQLVQRPFLMSPSYCPGKNELRAGGVQSGSRSHRGTSRPRFKGSAQVFACQRNVFCGVK